MLQKNLPFRLVRYARADLSRRTIHTTGIAYLKTQFQQGDDPIKNFETFKYPNQVTTFEHYKLPQSLLDYEYNYPVCRDTLGIRWPGYWFKRKFVYVKEMEPQLVVPDLTGFSLKPYVSYATNDVQNEPITATDLFNVNYSKDIAEKVRTGQIKHPDDYQVKPEEIDESRLKAFQTGADLFEDHTKDGVRADMKYVVEISRA